MHEYSEKNNSNIKQNVKTTKMQLPKQKHKQKSNPPHFQRSQYTMIQALYKNKRNIYIIMDSNRKFINFKELLLTEEKETNPAVIPCGNVKRAGEILKTNQIDSPH